MLQWKIDTYQLPLQFDWKIARGSSSSKTIHIVSVSDGTHTGQGEVASITKDQSSSTGLIDFFKEFSHQNVDSLSKITELALPSQLKFGLDSALTHLSALQKNKSVCDFLGRKKIDCVATSFSLPILNIEEIANFYQTMNLQRFDYLKLKVGHTNQVESCIELNRIYQGPIRIDANEAFSSAREVSNFITSLKGLPIEFIEQPMPAENHEEYKKLKSIRTLPIYADESVQDQDITREFSEMFDGINVKLMKAGGYQQAIKQIDQAKALGLKVMLGCMVETSLGISSALNIAEKVDHFDLDGCLFLKKDPFNYISESDGQIKRTTLSG